MWEKKPSQTQLYGELLTSEQRYHKELTALAWVLSDQEEQALVSRVRQGDRRAKDALLGSLLRYVQYKAMVFRWRYRWIQERGEYLDLIQEGNLTILSKWEEAMSKEHPPSFLKACARFAMWRYCMRYETAISTPDDSRATPFPVDSLEQLLPEGNKDKEPQTLADVLPAPAQPGCQPERDSQMERIEALMQRVLTPQQWQVLVCCYGLLEHAPQSVSDLAKAWGVSHSLICAQRESALQKLRQVLPEVGSVCEVYTCEEACQVLGVSKDNFSKNLTPRLHLKPVARGLYAKSAIDALAQQRQACMAG